MTDITVGLQLGCHQGEISRLRQAWVEAEEIGVDRLWGSDHCNAVVTDEEFMNNTNDGRHSRAQSLNVFEGATIQAAMAATTSRVEIGCMVYSNSYRNPRLLAYIANTIDQIAGGGRYILGVGTGFLKEDFAKLDIPYGTQKERSEQLARDVPIIRSHLEALIPAPVRRMPLLIATMGEKIGLPLAARQADMWHVYGPFEKIQAKTERLRELCGEQGRDPAEIELATYYAPHVINGREDTLENYVKLGINHIILVTEGPDWDLGGLREAVQWRDQINRTTADAAA
jgi:alkanesulfonate monooxygenase SsuD/methylene tetrahydromethanopterin reductase-like flavin-dependent oxidoreductase (luciferase family)